MVIAVNTNVRSMREITMNSGIDQIFQSELSLQAIH